LAKGTWKKFGILVVVFSAILVVEGMIVQAAGLGPIFAQNPIFAFIGPGAVAAGVYVGIDKYLLKMRVK